MRVSEAQRAVMSEPSSSLGPGIANAGRGGVEIPAVLGRMGVEAARDPVIDATAATTTPTHPAASAQHETIVRMRARLSTTEREPALLYPVKRGERREAVAGAATMKPVEVTMRSATPREMGRSTAFAAGVWAAR